MCPPNAAPSAETVIRLTRVWLERAVIGLNLCPFAKAVYVKQQVRFVVSAATTASELKAALITELQALTAVAPEQIDTTLLIHPQVLEDFFDFNDFLLEADAVLGELDLEGVIQIASFHPRYQFAGTAPDALENYTNRAPFPILHLLRETSVDKAVTAFPEAEAIFEKNIDTLETLGLAGWQALFTDEPDER